MTPESEPLSETETWQQRDARESAWRKSLKVGDQVLFQHGGYTPWYGGVVEKVSANYVTVSGKRFRRSDGHQAGRDGWGRNWRSDERVFDPIRSHV